MQITPMTVKNHSNHNFSNNTSFKSLMVQEKALKNLGYTTQKALIRDYPLLKKLSKNSNVIIKNCSRLVYNHIPEKICGIAGTLLSGLSIGAGIVGAINPAIGAIGFLAGFGIMALAKPKKETIDFTEIEVNKTNSDGSISKKLIKHEKEDSFKESIEILNYMINKKTESNKNEELDKLIYMRNWRDTSLELNKKLYEEEGCY